MSLHSWARAVASANAAHDLHPGYQCVWLARIRQVIADPASIALDDQQFGTLVYFLVDALSDMSYPGSTRRLLLSIDTESPGRISKPRHREWFDDALRFEATRTAGDLIEALARARPYGSLQIFWVHYFGLNPGHLDHAAMVDPVDREQCELILDILRRHLFSGSVGLATAALHGLNFIHGPGKERFVDEFLATKPGEEIADVAAGARRSSLW